MCETWPLVALVRDELDEFDSLAESSMLIMTVRMSPGLDARWSTKKARAPGRHRELGVEAGISWAGCGGLDWITVGWATIEAAMVLRPMSASLGPRIASLAAETVPQAAMERPTHRPAAV